MKEKVLAVCVMLAILIGLNQASTVAIAQEKDKHIIIEIGSQKFDAVLTNEEAANEFYGKLPLTLNMSELNGNEKYNYLPDSYTTNSKVANTIENGDIKLYGSSCMVLFYKTFSSGYSYTDIGKITNPEGLADAVGQGDVTVTFRTDQSTVEDEMKEPMKDEMLPISNDNTLVEPEKKEDIPAKSEEKNTENKDVVSRKVRLNYSKKFLEVGETFLLKLDGNSKKVKWSSSKKAVACVSSNGKVTAKKAGKAVIIAKVGKKKYKCEITVKKNVVVVAKVGKKKYYITMYNNKAAKQFIQQLPMKIKMRELNGNEKYYYMNQSLATKNQIGGNVKAGDFRLYDGNCLVWFYKPFKTSYSYTKLGYVKNSGGLKKALGSKNVTVKFSIKK